MAFLLLSVGCLAVNFRARTNYAQLSHPTKSHRSAYCKTGFDGLFNDGMGRYRLALSLFAPLYRQAKALYVEPEVHDVAILHHIIFALDA